MVDSDGDGVGDNVDTDDDDDGFSDTTEETCLTDSIILVQPIDTDGDGICDHLDSDNTDGPDYVPDDNNTPGFGLFCNLGYAMCSDDCRTQATVKAKRLECSPDAMTSRRKVSMVLILLLVLAVPQMPSVLSGEIGQSANGCGCHGEERTKSLQV